MTRACGDTDSVAVGRRCGAGDFFAPIPRAARRRPGAPDRTRPETPTMIRFLALALLLPGLAVAQPQLSGTPDELSAFLEPAPHQAFFTGRAEETAYSDRAIVEVIVTTEAKALAEALQRNQRHVAELRERYRDAGIPPERITAARFSTSPQYGWFGREPSAYVVANRLSVTVDGEDALIAVARSADELDQVRFGGLRFEHSEKAAAEARVRAAAAADAVAQAEAYGSALGLTAVPVRFESQSAMRAPSPGARRAAGFLEEVIVTGSASRSDYAERPAQPATFDETTYSAEVTVLFEIRPAGGPDGDG
ncbi:MAG: hypothetical protein CMQ43_12030 [Gammaproteobacteria bacterium]|nr:hypothetical protein [Gammaproteobacteria bacterium]MBK81625.1 hypothetical protein [Gammaproteobacteria bacterium]